MKSLLTVTEAAEELSISETTIYFEMARERLGSVKIGAARRIPADAIAEYVALLKSEPRQRLTSKPTPGSRKQQPATPPERDLFTSAPERKHAPA